MPYEGGKLILRRFQVQVHYHAAYLYWNLRGVLPEKWAHGPHFGAYTEAFERVHLAAKGGDPADIMGVYGLRLSAFVWERPDRKQGVKLCQEWLRDCLDVLQPRRVVRLYVQIAYTYPLLREKDRVSDSIVNRYALGDFAPANYKEVHAGTSFHARDDRGSLKVIATGIFGMYGPDQAGTMFDTKQPVDDTYCLGLVYDRNESDESGFRNPSKGIEEIIDRGFVDSQALIRESLIPVLADA